MADKKKKPDLGLLEEDDEFEEFPAQGEVDLSRGSYSVYIINSRAQGGWRRVQFGNDDIFHGKCVDWTGAEEDDTDVNVWEDNWDDDDIEEDFSQQLRRELEKQGFKPAEPMQQ